MNPPPVSKLGFARAPPLAAGAILLTMGKVLSELCLGGQSPVFRHVAMICQGPNTAGQTGATIHPDGGACGPPKTVDVAREGTEQASTTKQMERGAGEDE